MPHSNSDLLARNRIVGEIVVCLAMAEYEAVVALAPGSPVSPAQIKAAIEEYGRKLVPLPPEAYELIDYVAIRQSEPLSWSVVVPLFTQEEGRSDLSLELQLMKLATAGYEVSVNGLHVL